MAIAIIQICLNFVLNNGYLVFLSTNVSCFFTIWGILTMGMPSEEASSTIDVFSKIFINSLYVFANPQIPNIIRRTL